MIVAGSARYYQSPSSESSDVTILDKLCDRRFVGHLPPNKKRPRMRVHARTPGVRFAAETTREPFLVSETYLLPAVVAGAGAAADCWSRFNVYFRPAKNTDVMDLEPSSSLRVA